MGVKVAIEGFLNPKLNQERDYHVAPMMFNQMELHPEEVKRPDKDFEPQGGTGIHVARELLILRCDMNWRGYM